MDRHLDNAPLMLGLNFDETTQVKAVFSRASDEIAAAEKAYVEIAETPPEKLRLDLSPMTGPLKKSSRTLRTEFA